MNVNFSIYGGIWHLMRSSPVGETLRGSGQDFSLLRPQTMKDRELGLQKGFNYIHCSVLDFLRILIILHYIKSVRSLLQTDFTLHQLLTICSLVNLIFGFSSCSKLLCWNGIIAFLAEYVEGSSKKGTG